MTKVFNRKVGARGEGIAAGWLEAHGYQLIDKNNSTKWGELDLIVSKDNILVFVEVKLKSTEEFGMPEEMIGQSKLAQVKKTAEMYLLDNPEIANKFDRYQIDAVCIVESTGRINHYENLTF